MGVDRVPVSDACTKCRLLVVTEGMVETARLSQSGLLQRVVNGVFMKHQLPLRNAFLNGWLSYLFIVATGHSLKR